MAKKRIKQLGLSRKGRTVQYSAIEDIQAAIEVPGVVEYKFIGDSVTEQYMKPQFHKDGIPSSDG